MDENHPSLEMMTLLGLMCSWLTLKKLRGIIMVVGMAVGEGAGGPGGRGLQSVINGHKMQ